MEVILVKNCYVDGEPRKAGETVDTTQWRILVGMKKAVKLDDIPKVVASTKGRRGKKSAPTNRAIQSDDLNNREDDDNVGND